MVQFEASLDQLAFEVDRQVIGVLRIATCAHDINDVLAAIRLWNQGEETLQTYTLICSIEFCRSELNSVDRFIGNDVGRVVLTPPNWLSWSTTSVL